MGSRNVNSASEGMKDSFFLRRILDPVKQVQKHFSQESLQMRKHGILKQKRSTCNGNNVDFPLQEMLDTTVFCKVHDNGVLGF